MGKIIYISGGISSGKSSFAEEICSEKNKKTVYIATAIPFDSEMIEKRKKHVARRKNKDWDTIEKHTEISKIIDSNEFIYELALLDCITMLISNLIFEDSAFDINNKKDREKISKKIEVEIDNLLMSISVSDCDFIIVSNEIGLGGISENSLTRYFADICGKVNQKIARQSKEAYFVASGIAIKMK
ncbi:MAG: bifunctional adenosylcobinamide kinase/adenosylcobinamide-phosphate guanylyltransferase [Peptostreptococcus sp.]|uniref:bifunctional adenosylcobinamide kinase/adenosylcobinamide-phosphate guanylyltransferase n=1 Tax=Peptostreptococcus sp. TaxID=1262 RepID=UPI002FCBBD2E